MNPSQQPETPFASHNDEDGRPANRALTAAMSSLIQRFADRGRVQIEKAAYASRNRLVQRQTRRDLNHFWIRLGKTAFHLTEAGEIEHPALRKAMARIQHLQDEIAAGHNYDDGTGAPGPRKSSDSRP